MAEAPGSFCILNFCWYLLAFDVKGTVRDNMILSTTNISLAHGFISEIMLSNKQRHFIDRINLGHWGIVVSDKELTRYNRSKVLYLFSIVVGVAPIIPQLYVFCRLYIY